MSLRQIVCREAYHESVQLGHELTKKANGDNGTEGVAENVWIEENEDDSDKHKGVTGKAYSAFDRVLNGTDDNEPTVVKGKFSKLFDMDFMKRAIEQKKERAREEAQDILKDLDAMENGDISDDDSNVKNSDKVSSTPQNKQKLADAKKTLAAQLGKGNSMKISVINKSIDVETVPSADVNSSYDNKANENTINPWLVTSVKTSRDEVNLVGAQSKKSKKNNSSVVRGSVNKEVTNDVVVSSKPKISASVSKSIPVTTSSGAIGKQNEIVHNAPTTMNRKPLLMQKSQVRT